MQEKKLQLFQDGKVTTQDGREFTRLVGGFGEDKPIITTKQIAELMGYVNGDKTVNLTITRNIKSFEENIHIIDVKNSVSDGNPVQEVLKTQGYSKQSISNSKNIYVLSEAGFLLYLKFAEGDKAVELYKSFIEDYFKTKAENKIMEQTLTEELEFLKQEKKFILGSMFMESDDKKKMDFFNQNEKINSRIKEIEITLSKENLIEQLKPQLTIADRFSNMNGLYDVGVFSKILSIKGLGRNNLFEWLREQSMLRSNNEPYQKYMDYFEVRPVENKYTNVVNYKTMIKPKGILYIMKKLIEDGKVIPKTTEQVLKELEPLQEAS